MTLDIEKWKEIQGFPGYSVSNFGRVRSDKFDRILSPFMNQYEVQCIGMMRDGEQRHRSVPRLVANAFLRPHKLEAFSTPINLDGNRSNNHVSNLMWRPRWFAVKYNRQFTHPSDLYISTPIMEMKTRDISINSRAACMQYGLLEYDLVMSIMNRTVVWPTYQEFRVVDENQTELLHVHR